MRSHSIQVSTSSRHSRDFEAATDLDLEGRQMGWKP